MDRLIGGDNIDINYERFFSINPDLLCAADLEGNIIKLNKSWKTILGYTIEELEGRKFMEFVHPKDREATQNAMITLSEQHQLMEFINRYKCQDGAYRYLEWRAQLYGDIIYATARDITEKLEQQQTIEEKENNFKQCFETMENLLFVATAEGLILHTNQVVVKKLGYSEEKLRTMRRDLGLFVEKEEQSDAAFQLQENEHKLFALIESRKAILDNLPFLAWLKNEKGKFMEVNIVFQQACGKAAEEIIGHFDYDIWPAELAEKYRSDDEEVMKSGRRMFVEEMIDDRQGGMWFETYKTPIYDMDGRVVGTTGISRDITLRKSMEEKLVTAKEQAESATLMKSQFLANMSHEIRTPMNGIFGYLELLQRTGLSSEQKEFIREAKSSSELLLYLINDILDFSKIEAGKLKIEKINFNLRTTFEDAVSILVPKAMEKKLELNTMIDANVPEEVIGDPARLRQIINNLVSNAVKFTEKGEVFVAVSSINQPDNQAQITFVVQDTGIGMSEDVLEGIFNPFIQADGSTTRKFGGTGLGLAISKELVKIMEGDITVKSEPGHGSVFTFNILLEVSQEAKSLNIFKELKGENVLVVDDHETNRKIVRAYLEETGCRVFEAEDVGNAISILLMNATTAAKIGVAIIDYHLGGLNGFQLASTLKSLPFAKDVKLILLTSSAQRGEGEVAKKHGFLGYLTKPVRRNELCNCLALALGLKRDEEGDHPIITKHTVKEAMNALKPRILLVDDYETNRKIVIAMLKSEYMTCDVARDGSEALRALAEKDYDIVFMDCQMPVMDGYESTAKIREIEGDKKHTIIIAMTANAMEGDRASCIAAGMDDYISKPINYETLFKLIEANTKQKEQRSGHIDLEDSMEAFMKSTGIKKDDTQEIFTDFMNNLPDQLESIKESINNNFEKLRKLVHQLKGSSVNLRLTSIYELAAKLEEAAIRQDKEECERFFREMQSLLN